MVFEHAGILTLMADIMARTLLIPLTISRIGTLPNIPIVPVALTFTLHFAQVYTDPAIITLHALHRA